ncbi:hypothetical protein GGF46_000390 [Coemansia sp. RSA 552]|nr:hypothetical protein GGF46_000390 [Coemansia sp. RSA 552]
MQAIIGLVALAMGAIAAPASPPIDPNNPLTNPATNRDLLLVNPSLIRGNGFMTPEQQLTVHNQLLTQKNLENFAAQLSAQAGVPPPAGIAPHKSNVAPTREEAAQLQAQVNAQAQIQAQAQHQAAIHAQLQAQNQALIQQQAAAQLQAMPRAPHH